MFRNALIIAPRKGIASWKRLRRGNSTVETLIIAGLVAVASYNIFTYFIDADKGPLQSIIEWVDDGIGIIGTLTNALGL